MNDLQLTMEERLLFEKLKDKIRAYVMEEVDRIVLAEMAYSRKDFKTLVRDRMNQLITNWCLVRYSTIDKRYKILHNHWCSELYAIMSSISRMKLKHGNNTETKQNVLYTIWSEEEFDRDEGSIDWTIKNKFTKEGIDTTSDGYIQTVSDCKNATKDIVNAILSGSEKELTKYIMSI